MVEIFNVFSIFVEQSQNIKKYVIHLLPSYALVHLKYGVNFCPSGEHNVAYMSLYSVK